MNLNNLIPGLAHFGSTDTEIVTTNVGTPEKPIELPLGRIYRDDSGNVSKVDSARPVLTGRNASKSEQARVANFLKDGGEDKDVFLPLRARAQRRNQVANSKRQYKRGRRAFVRREWSKEREANQLAQLFNIVDRLVPASPRMRLRAQEAISARIVFLRDLQQAAYDKQIKARQANRDLPAPSPVQRHEDIERELRGLAKTASTRMPKVQAG